MWQKRVNLFGILVDDISLEKALVLSRRALAKGEKMVVFTPNLEFLRGAKGSKQLKGILNSASIALPDGFSLRIVARLLGEELKNTVAGIDFGENLLRLCAKGGRSVFLIGGEEGIAFRASLNLIKRCPSLKICGTHHGYFSSSEQDNVIERINSSDAEVVLVCMGFPRQEKFVFENIGSLEKVKIIACLGGSLDVWAHKTKRAPRYLRDLHLEWLWRILLEPERATRFARSLCVLGEATLVFLKNECALIGISAKALAYNLTDVCS